MAGSLVLMIVLAKLELIEGIWVQGIVVIGVFGLLIFTLIRVLSGDFGPEKKGK